MTQHRSTLDSCSNHIWFQYCIICRASLKTIGDIRLNYLCWWHHVPTSQRCTNTNNINIQLPDRPGLCIVLRIARHPRRQSKALPTIRSVVSEYVNVTSGTTGSPIRIPNFSIATSFETAPTSTVISFSYPKEPYAPVLS